MDGNELKEMLLDPNVNHTDFKRKNLYQRHFEEGYDIYDPEYLEWLEKNLPVDIHWCQQLNTICDLFSHNFITPMQSIELSNVDLVTAT